MHHAAAQHFQPARAAVRLLPGDVDFCARLDERKVAGTEAHLEIALEERTHELGQRALEVGERGVFVDQQAFDLVEHRRMRLVAVAAVDLARRDHPQRRLVGVHVTHLHAGGMRAQQAAIAEVERVVHGARRVMRREVQRFEVVPVVLDLRAVGQLVAQSAENVGDALQRAADRMQPAPRAVPARQRYVDGFAGQARVERGVFQHGFADRQRLADRIARAIDRFAGGLALVGGQCPQLLQLRGDAAVLAQQGDAQLFHHVGRLCCRDVGQGLLGQGFDIAHWMSMRRRQPVGAT